MRYAQLAVLITFLASFTLVSHARPKPGVNEPTGTWAFETDRPIKVMVVGGSISEFSVGFGKQLEGVCRKIEVVNIAKARYNAWAIGQRFEAQVIRNPNLNLKAPGLEYWIMVQGGLNGIWSPTEVNRHLRDMFVTAHKHGIGVVGLSLSPWGSEDDKRFRGMSGVEYQEKTQLAVDFVMGRLSPADAIGAKNANKATRFESNELPDIAVDLYDSSLRDASAPIRSVGAIDDELKSSKYSKRLTDSPDPARERLRLIDQSRRLPQWYLRKDIRSFDHIHPNKDGHREIARIACPKLPADWDCDCAGLELAPAPKPTPKAVRQTKKAKKASKKKSSKSRKK